MTVFRMTKEQVLDRLREQLPVAEAYDAQRLAEHKKAEAAHLALFRSACRQAAKWSYEEAKENEFNPLKLMGNVYEARRGPSCPESVAVAIRKAIRDIEIDRRTNYTITDGGIHFALHRLIIWEPNPERAEAC